MNFQHIFIYDIEYVRCKICVLNWFKDSKT